jgi:hypothetical protein
LENTLFPKEHNLGSPDNVSETLKKISLEVWSRVNEFYWYGSKKAGVFIRERARALTARASKIMVVSCCVLSMSMNDRGYKTSATNKT